MEFGKQWQGQTADGRFPLEQFLGGSQETAVFLTRLPDKQSSNKAAIKLLLAGPDADARLADWGRAVELSHPHLVRTFECGRCWLSGKELLYVVSECADENLAQVVPQRALSNEEADALLRPAMKALAYLHDRGLVHGHVRPSNVMAVNDQLKLSSDGVRVAGSPSRKPEASGYDAPEVAAGDLSPAADVWSLGALLVEALSRRMPAGKVGSDVGLQSPYDEIVRRCLVKNPSSRWTVRDIAGAIHLELPWPKPGTQADKKTISSVPSTSLGSRPGLLKPVLILGALIAATLAIVLTVRVSSALRTIQGHLKVRVQVAVDGVGNVSNARFLSPGPSKYFSRLAMEAAQQWKFRPANGQSSPSEWNLLFEFTRGGVQAFPQQVRAR